MLPSNLEKMLNLAITKYSTKDDMKDFAAIKSIFDFRIAYYKFLG